MKKITEKKKDMALQEGADVSGYVMKKGEKYQIIADGRVVNLTEKDFRKLMQYPD